jgi:hypothetical protein
MEYTWVPTLISAGISAAAGVGGVAVGAWKADRRETRAIKRDTYLKLLRALVELKELALVAQKLNEALPRPDLSSALAGAEPTAAHTELEAENRRLRTQAEASLRDATAAALLLFDDEGLEALGGLAAGWRLAGDDIPSYRAAVDQAILRLRKTGKKDLGL